MRSAPHLIDGGTLDRFASLVHRVEAGELPPAEFRAFRVPNGVYEERTDGSFMLRVRLVAGRLSAAEARVAADVARRYGRTQLHVTSRQDLQVHGVALHRIHGALVDLTAGGLSTKGGGGNSVRNLSACCAAGVCSREVFDVTPWVSELTGRLLDDPLSLQLPRKYKIGFSGCDDDCAGATVQDVGFVARERAGERGFAVYVGGGMGAHSRLADLLEEFVPVDDAFLVAEAIKRVYDRLGNRRDRHRARLRFLVEQMGIEAFRGAYRAELEGLVSAGGLTQASVGGPTVAASSLRAIDPPVALAVSEEGGFGPWLKNNTERQRQPGYFLVHVPLVLGDVTAEQLDGLAAIAELLADGVLYATPAQNLAIHWVGEADLHAVWTALLSLGLGEAVAPVVRNAVSCTGSSTCRLGMCLSRGLATAVVDELHSWGPDLDALGDLRVQISGCPNSCGRHPIADVGFFGGARRIGGRLVPHYSLQLGGRVGVGRARLAEGRDALPARNVPAFLSSFLRAYAASGLGYEEFLAGEGRTVAAELVRLHRIVPEGDEAYARDWGADEPFSLAGRGPGECGAGVFDLIELDLAGAGDALGDGRPFAATVHAARALLVTKGEEAEDESQALELFTRCFLDEGLVDGSFAPLVSAARRALDQDDREAALAGSAVAGLAEGLIEAVRALYVSLDDSLRFRSSAASLEEVAAGEAVEVAVSCGADAEVDFRGVVCPLNYVKTKLRLSQMAPGEVLSVLLDQAGARNVPESTAKDGNDVLAVQAEDGHWRVLIRRA